MKCVILQIIICSLAATESTSMDDLYENTPKAFVDHLFEEKSHQQLCIFRESLKNPVFGSQNEATRQRLKEIIDYIDSKLGPDNRCKKPSTSKLEKKTPKAKGFFEKNIAPYGILFVVLVGMAIVLVGAATYIALLNSILKFFERKRVVDLRTQERMPTFNIG